jgi:hypothetical protein
MIKSGKVYHIRKLPAVTAMEDGVDRCAEMGAPVSIAHTGGDLSSGSTGIYATTGVSLSGYISKLAITKDVRMIIKCAKADSYVMCLEQLRGQYIAAGKGQAFSSDDCQLVSEITSAVWETLEKDKPAFHANLGMCGNQTLAIGEACYRNKVFAISGGAELAQLPFQVLAFDYCLLADEFFAASAYVTGDPIQQGSVVTQDWIKLIAIVLVLSGMAGTALGYDFIGTYLET